jgi:hypothetical protein
MEEAWQIIKLTAIHCGIAVSVCAIFSAALYALSIIYSAESPVVWWFSNVDLTLAIITSTVLALMFLNALLRIALHAIIGSWKGFLHVNSFSIVA